MGGGAATPERLECRFSRSILYFGVIGGGAFVVLGLALFLTGPVGLVLGILCIAFFGYIAVGAWRTLRSDDGSPVLVVGDDGLLDKRLRPTPIPWTQIEGVDVRPGPTIYSRWQRYINLKVTDPAQVLRGVRPATRIATEFNQAFGYEPLTLSAANLDRTADQIADAIRAHLSPTASGC